MGDTIYDQIGNYRMSAYAEMNTSAWINLWPMVIMVLFVWVMIAILQNVFNYKMNKGNNSSRGSDSSITAKNQKLHKILRIF